MCYFLNDLCKTGVMRLGNQHIIGHYTVCSNAENVSFCLKQFFLEVDIFHKTFDLF